MGEGTRKEIWRSGGPEGCGNGPLVLGQASGCEARGRGAPAGRYAHTRPLLTVRFGLLVIYLRPSRPPIPGPHPPS